MYRPKYAMFFDLHTMQACPDVGHAFDAEKFAEQLHNAGADLVGFHAKCNQGFCYFDTKTGIRHPSLPEGRDLFGEVVTACNKRGIQVSAYFNCGLSNEDAIRHPDWSRIGMHGEALHPEIYDLGWVTPYMRTMCMNSPWHDHLLGLIREVRDRYPVAGFLFDSFNVFPCVCPVCTAMMREQGLDPNCEADVMKFARQSSLRMATDISELVRPKENGLLTYFLGISAKMNAKIGSYLECECLPTNPSWGYDFLPLTSRYYRTLTDGPVLNMTGRFNNWGDFGSLRPQAAVEYDLFFGLANGMRPNIGDHLHPRGDLNECVFERIGSIYRKIRRYDEWFDGAENLVDIGVVFSGSLTQSHALIGATRMLSELKMQFDFIDRDSDWSKYKILILPDDILLDDVLAAKAEAHLQAGKKLIATGKSGLDPAEKQFRFGKVWGAEYQGPCDYDPAYFRLSGAHADEVPAMPLATYSKGLRVRALDPSNVAGKIVAPYYNRHWDGMYSYYYTPPDKLTGLPFLILNEQSAYCAYPLCESYYEHASPDLRKVLEIMLRHVFGTPLLKTGKNLPSFARAFVTQKGKQRIVHLLNYVPELRGKTLLIEEEIPAKEVEVSLRLDGAAVKKVYLAPDRTELPFRTADGYVHFTVPEMSGYCMIVTETE